MHNQNSARSTLRGREKSVRELRKREGEGDSERKTVTDERGKGKREVERDMNLLYFKPLQRVQVKSTQH